MPLSRIRHSRTIELPLWLAGELLIAAIRAGGFSLPPTFRKPGATVIDVGTDAVDESDVVDRLLPGVEGRLEAFARRGALVFGGRHPEVESVGPGRSAGSLRRSVR